MTALTGQDLIAWNEATSQGWKKLISAHPEALGIPCDIRETRSVGELLQHIVAVELRYAERLQGLLESPYESIPYDSAETIYYTHDLAMALLKQLQAREDSFWDESISFTTRRGDSVSVARRYVFVHTLMHSIRHYAQLATLVRQHGIAPDWPMDYLFMAPRES